MMTLRLTSLSKLPFVLTLFLLVSLAPAQQQRLKAPTYYVAMRVRECWSTQVTLLGATNLPPGAILALLVGVPLNHGSGALDLKSSPATAVVDQDGFFTGILKPKPGQLFDSSQRLVAYVDFAPGTQKQPSSVLRV